MTTDQSSKRIEELVDRIVQARDQAQANQRESSDVVQVPTQLETKANGQRRRKNGVGKLRQTTVGTAKKAATVPTLIPQPHGGALNSGGTPGNRGGGRPSHAVKHALCGDLEIAHQRIRSLLYDPSLRFTDLLDLYGELLDRLERYGF
jgi:hypothetical protein